MTEDELTTIPIARPLFELRHGNHIWCLYENGETSGFPEGTIVFNRAASEFNRLRAQLRLEFCEFRDRITTFETAWNAYQRGEPTGSLHKERYLTLERAFVDLVLPRYCEDTK